MKSFFSQRSQLKPDNVQWVRYYFGYFFTCFRTYFLNYIFQKIMQTSSLQFSNNFIKYFPIFLVIFMKQNFQKREQRLCQMNPLYFKLKFVTLLGKFISLI